MTSSRLFPIDHPGIFNSAPIIELSRGKNENERLNTLEKRTYVYSRFFLFANLMYGSILGEKKEEVARRENNEANVLKTERRSD